MRTNKQTLVKNDIDMDLAINTDYINDELMDQPLLYRKWAEMSSQANKNVKIVNSRLDRIKAKYHLLFSKEGLKVKEVESKVLLAEEVQQIEEELFKAEQLAEDLKGVVQAFRQRHESLRELSTNIRKEIED